MKKSVFQVNLTGILKVLSDNLYSHREVFLRELLQNAIDAIAARQQVEKFDPVINIEFYDSAAGTGIIFNDNGIGLTEAEVEEFLSRIGSSSKSMEEMGDKRKDFIGQFGIGLLSCFMVSDEIVVLTKSARAGKTIRWTGYIDGSYAVDFPGTEMPTGTRVMLKLKKDAGMNEKKLHHFVALYGEYTGIPITIDADRQVYYVGRNFVWEKEYTKENALSFGHDLFKERFLVSIPLSDTTGQTQGLAFINPSTTHHGATQHNRVYIKKMLVTTKATNLLPEWAFFVRAVVNSGNLSPTASREDIYSNKASDTVREELGECIKNYFRYLAKNDPHQLGEIIDLHGNAFKSIALSDQDFLAFICDYFRFPTSKGDLSLKEIKNLTHHILYISDLDQFRQIMPVANAGNTLIVNAAYIYDADILHAVSQIDNKYLYSHINAEYFGNVLNELDLDEYDACQERLQALAFYLDPFGCELLLKKFEPASIPALFYQSRAQQVEKDIGNIRSASPSFWNELSSGIFQTEKENSSRLFLNYKNPLVSKLLHNKDARYDRHMVEILYTQAMLLGHYPLNHTEMTSLNNGLIFMMENLI